MTFAGLILVLASVVGYVALLFVVGGFTYRTWIFDGVVVAGMALAGVGWATGDRVALPMVALAVGVFWFGFTRAEFRLRGSDRLAVKRGDRLPALTAVTVDGAQLSERDLTVNGPAVLTLYRGWWCPTSKVQLDAILAQHDALVEAGLAVFAGSVDGPDEAKPIQEHVGEAIVILCDIPERFLDEIGVRDQRGAPWYDRLLVGAAKQPISMPAVLLIGADGRLISADRSSRLDDGNPFTEIMARLLGTAHQEEHGAQGLPSNPGA